LNVVVSVMSPPKNSKTPSVAALASDRISNVPLITESMWNVTVPSWALAPAGKPMPKDQAGAGAEVELMFSIRDPVSVAAMSSIGRAAIPGVFAYPSTVSDGTTEL
jgi:hypothetical protein